MRLEDFSVDTKEGMSSEGSCLRDICPGGIFKWGGLEVRVWPSLELPSVSLW